MNIKEKSEPIDSYKKAIKTTTNEAKWTFILAISLFAYFVVSIFFTLDSEITIVGFPLWFVVGVVGGFALSFVGVALLLKKVFKEMPLEFEEEK